MKKHPESGIPLASSDTNDKYVKTLPCYTQYMDSVKKAKKTGSVKVKASEYISPCVKFVIGGTLTILSWDNPVTAFFSKKYETAP